ncbi:hypothetical protein LA080_011643 [Diaporthe eres]|nr:hypothetical protein LA080_011643 [Diaporthe eres]
MAPAHPYRSLNIGPGDVLKASFVVRKPHERITELDVQAGFHQLPPRQKQQFLCLRDNGTRAFTSMEKAFRENSFAVATNPPAHGLLIVLSRFNHSCLPNCKVPSDGPEKDQLQPYATMAVMAGEELTFCYNTDFELRTTQDRTQRLGFHVCAPVLGDPEVKKAAEELRIPQSTRLIAVVMMGFLLEEEDLMDQFMFERLRPSMKSVAALFQTASNARIAALVMAQSSWLGRVCMAFKLYGKEDGADQEIAAKLKMAREAGLL